MLDSIDIVLYTEIKKMLEISVAVNFWAYIKAVNIGYICQIVSNSRRHNMSS